MGCWMGAEFSLEAPKCRKKANRHLLFAPRDLRIRISSSAGGHGRFLIKRSGVRVPRSVKGGAEPRSRSHAGPRCCQSIEMSRHNRYLCPVSCPSPIPTPIACWHDSTRVFLSIIFYDMHDYHKIRDVRSSTDYAQDSPSLCDLPWYVEKRLALQDAIGKSRPRLIDSMVTCPFRPIRRIPYFARSLCSGNGWGFVASRSETWDCTWSVF